MVAIFRGWIAALTEALFFLPIALLVYAYTVPNYYSLLAVWLLPVVSLLGAGGHVLGLRVRWKQALAALLLGLGYAGVVFFSGGYAVLHALCGTLLAMQAMAAPGRENRLKLYWVGIALYFIAGIVFPRFDQLSAYVTIVTLGGIVSLGILLFITNRQYLNYNSLTSSSEKSTIPKGVRRYNTAWIASIFVVALLLAAGAGRWAGNLLLGLLRSIVQWLLRPSDEPASEPEPPASQEPSAEMALPESGPPGWLSQVLDVLYNIVAGVLLLAVIALIGYGIYKYAGPTLSRLVGKLKKFFLHRGTEPVRQAYEDEEVRLSLRGTGRKRGQWAGKWTARLFKEGEGWSKLLDNRERIRYLYRRQRQLDEARGIRQPLSLTPREQEQELQRKAAMTMTEGKGRRASATHTNRDVMEPLLDVYYRVRYGDQQPGDAEVSLLKDKIQS